MWLNGVHVFSAFLYQALITQSLIIFSHGRFLILQMYDYWDLENILITTDSAPYA